MHKLVLFCHAIKNKKTNKQKKSLAYKNDFLERSLEKLHAEISLIAKNFENEMDCIISTCSSA